MRPQSPLDWHFEWRRTWADVWNPAFVAAWERLFRQSSDATVFHEPAVVRAWAETRGVAVGAEPLFGVASRPDGPTVLLTFVVQKNRGRHATRRAISAVGDAFFGYHDPLVAGVDSAAIDWPAFWDRVRQETAAYGDHTLLRFVNAKYGRWPFVVASTTPSPVLDLSQCSTLEDVPAKCSSKHRQDIRRQRRRLEEEVGPVPGASKRLVLVDPDIRCRSAPVFARAIDVCVGDCRRVDQRSRRVRRLTTGSRAQRI